MLFSLAVCGSLKAAVAYDRLNVTNVPGSAVNAVPNDGSSDTAGIMAAVNYTYPSGTYVPTKSIYFPAGTYIFDGSNPLILPSNTSIRLYGDGPGVSTIIFSGTNPGITGSMGSNTLQIEGLTLQGNVTNFGTAISATFTPDNKRKSATIRNVQIRGTSLTITPTGFWKNGIDLNGASNAIIEDVQIHGAFAGSAALPTDAINWHAPAVANSGATQLFVKNLSVLYYKTGVRTSGHVEGLYMSSFELVFCGSETTAAMEITAQGTVGEPEPVFHIMNGHINQVYSGIKMSNIMNVQISHVNFFNIIGTGNHILLTNVLGSHIVENSFIDFDCGNTPNCTPITAGNGIYLAGTTSGTRISGNSFSLNNQAGGQCILVTANCTKTAILDNDFGDSANRINDQTGGFPITFIRNIWP